MKVEKDPYIMEFYKRSYPEEQLNWIFWEWKVEDNRIYCRGKLPGVDYKDWMPLMYVSTSVLFLPQSIALVNYLFVSDSEAKD